MARKSDKEKSAAASASASGSESEEEEFVVEKIIDRRVTKHGKVTCFSCIINLII